MPEHWAHTGQLFRVANDGGKDRLTISHDGCGVQCLAPLASEGFAVERDGREQVLMSFSAGHSYRPGLVTFQGHAEFRQAVVVEGNFTVGRSLDYDMVDEGGYDMDGHGDWTGEGHEWTEESLGPRVVRVSSAQEQASVHVYGGTSAGGAAREAVLDVTAPDGQQPRLVLREGLESFALGHDGNVLRLTRGREQDCVPQQRESLISSSGEQPCVENSMGTEDEDEMFSITQDHPEYPGFMVISGHAQFDSTVHVEGVNQLHRGDGNFTVGSIGSRNLTVTSQDSHATFNIIGGTRGDGSAARSDLLLSSPIGRFPSLVFKENLEHDMSEHANWAGDGEMFSLVHDTGAHRLDLSHNIEPEMPLLSIDASGPLLGRVSAMGYVAMKQDMVLLGNLTIGHRLDCAVSGNSPT